MDCKIWLSIMAHYVSLLKLPIVPTDGVQSTLNIYCSVLRFKCWNNILLKKSSNFFLDACFRLFLGRRVKDGSSVNITSDHLTSVHASCARPIVYVLSGSFRIERAFALQRVKTASISSRIALLHFHLDISLYSNVIQIL